MIKKIILVGSFLIFTCYGYAQIANDVMVGGGFDLIKTDYSSFFGKAQIGGEVNYFITKDFTATAGLEVWTDDQLSFVIGGRYYPVNELFLRARGLIGVNDLSIGAGWTKPIGEKVRLEAMADFYFDLQFAVRIGFGYVFRKN
jgi:hypothetical protein